MKLVKYRIPAWLSAPLGFTFRTRTGEERPAVVVRQWNPDCANLIVFLDGGNDLEHAGPDLSVPTPHTVWVTSAQKGTSDGQWTEE